MHAANETCAFQHKRVYDDHTKPLEQYTTEELYARFQFGNADIKPIADLVRPKLQCRTRRNQSLAMEEQVLIALCFCASQSFHRLGDRVGISQLSISRALPRVVNWINLLATQCLKFPYTAEEQVPVKRGFHCIAGLPNTIGATDCTHVCIKAPSPDLFTYLNRKQYHSINVRLICDSQNHLLYVDSHFPGGAHDSFSLQNSSVGMHRGYALAPWLIILLTNPQTRQEVSFNQKHARTRSTVKHTIGILKGRWMCLDTAGCKLLYKPEKVCRIIRACCILHNIAMKCGVPLPPKPQERGCAS
uniref:Putative nuclease HARBI1 n=1 Tax=Seriola lalandi dorsalis TaxID=1841481 RepID=A0A3B4XDK2_SERLL